MERRFLLFITLSILLLTANTFWVAREQAEQRRAAEQAPAAKGDKPAAAGQADDAADEAADGDAERGSDADNDADAAEGEADANLPEEAEGAVADELVTLGSVDPASDYRMLVTLANRGAAVRRIELANPRYLESEDRRGYLGHLELKADGEPGLAVQAVGAGTPAAAAGLKAGDRLLEAGVKTTVAVKKPDDLDRMVDASKPRQRMSLIISRDGARQTLTATLARRPLQLVRPEVENILARQHDLPENFKDDPSFLLTLAQIDDRALGADAAELADVELRGAAWRITARDASSVTFERRVPKAHLTVTKRYALARADDKTRTDANAPLYHLTLEITIANAAADAGGRARTIAYQLDGPNGLPIEGWWYSTKSGREWGAAGIRDVVGRYFGYKPQQISAVQIATGKAESFEGAQAMAYMGVDAHYFCVAMLPVGQDPQEPWIASAKPIVVGQKPAEPHHARFANVTARLRSEAASLAPGEKLAHTYTVFAGPKRPALLEQYMPADQPGYSLDDFVYYGWFGAVSRAMVGVLHVFYGVVRNYGVAIIMLTILVRLGMFPISRAQARSMAKLQELRPEMERIKERYKGDQQKYAQATRDLYRKHNVNPLGGCLPALIQFPVFIGLWRGLAVDVELRQAPLFGSAVRWCSDLAAPDMFWNWSHIMPQSVNTGEAFLVGLGPYLNLLPLVTIALFLWQQKMFMPPPANEQAELQQKIMKYMMIFVSIMFYKVPSGLCLYLIVSSLWGIGERLLFPPPTAAAVGGAAAAPSAAASGDRRAAKNGRAADRSGPKSKRRK